MQLQTCWSWKRAADAGVTRLQSDNAWTFDQLREILAKLPGLTSLDLQNCDKFEEPLTFLRSHKKLRHLRLCRLTALVGQEVDTSVRLCRNLETLALAQ